MPGTLPFATSPLLLAGVLACTACGSGEYGFDGMYTFDLVEGLAVGTCDAEPSLMFFQVTLAADYGDNGYSLVGFVGGDLSDGTLDQSFSAYDEEDGFFQLKFQSMVRAGHGPVDGELHIDAHGAEGNFSGFARWSSPDADCSRRNFALFAHIEKD